MLSFLNTKGLTAALALTIVLSLAAMPTMAVADDRLRFIVFGDAPYSDEQSRELEEDLAPMIREAKVPFLIHLGDFKGSKESCTKLLIRKRYNQLMNLHPRPVFYTPGDNEWTDCDHTKKLEPKDRRPELERLDFLRTLIRSRPLTLPDGWNYARQPNFPENARWTQGKVMFATVHIVGTNNGRHYIDKDDIERALDLVDKRDEANRVWLKEAFDAAHKYNSGAVVIASQADVIDVENDVRDMPCSRTVRMRCDAFAPFRDHLMRLAAGFKKPVLFVHGDTKWFCLDKTFGGKIAPLLWRLNALGDTTSKVDATDITVRFHDENRPFEIKPLTTDESLEKCR